VQYDQMAEVSASDVFWAPDKLARFELHNECIGLLGEGAEVACQLLSAVPLPELDGLTERALLARYLATLGSEEHARQLLGIAHRLLDMAGKGPVPPIESASQDVMFLRAALQLLAARQWLSGDASILQRVAGIELRAV
jgi:hypothetical protein